MYKQTLSAKLANGFPLPDFITSLTDQGLVNVHATSAFEVGLYEVEITSTLSNYALFTDEDSIIDPAMLLDPNNLPDAFIYKASFILTVNVTMQNLIMNATVVTPFFIPEPTDLWFFSGGYFDHSFGKVYGSTGHAFAVTVDFGDAASFVDWDSSTNTMSVQ